MSSKREGGWEGGREGQREGGRGLETETGESQGKKAAFGREGIRKILGDGRERIEEGGNRYRRNRANIKTR